VERVISFFTGRQQDFFGAMSFPAASTAEQKGHSWRRCMPECLCNVMTLKSVSFAVQPQYKLEQAYCFFLEHG